MRPAVPALVLSADDNALLDTISKSRTARYSEVQRAQALLMAGVRVLGNERGTDNLSSIDQRDRSAMSVMVRLRPPGRVPLSANHCNNARSDARLSAGGAGDLPRAFVVALGESPPKGREILSGQLIDGNNAIALILPSHRYIVA